MNGIAAEKKHGLQPLVILPKFKQANTVADKMKFFSNILLHLRELHTGAAVGRCKP